MPSAADLVPILHRMVLLAFVGATALSMLAALTGRVRLRCSVLAWRRPGVLVRPLLGPVLFLLLVVGGFGHAWLTGRSVPTALLVGYPARGLFWLAATWMLRTVVVTEYGIVHDLSRMHRTVLWGQVIDYFTTTRQGRPTSSSSTGDSRGSAVASTCRCRRPTRRPSTRSLNGNLGPASRCRTRTSAKRRSVLWMIGSTCRSSATIVFSEPWGSRRLRVQQSRLETGTTVCILVEPKPRSPVPDRRRGPCSRSS